MSLPVRSSAALRADNRPRPGKSLMALAAIAVGVVSAGTCPFPLFEQHGLGSYFEHCRDDQPLLSHFFLLTDPTGVNSTNVDAVCREAPSLTSQLIPCQPEAGVPGDNRVTIQFDWGGVGPTFPGCPDLIRSENGGARIYSHTVTVDGTSILTSLAFSVDLSSYFVETAQPWTGTESVPLSCDDPERRLLRIDGTSPSGGTLNVDLTVFAPKISTDCDPGSGGDFIDLCNPAAPIAAVTPGRVYLQRGSCTGLPVPDLRTPAWTLLADSDAQGHASVSFPDAASDECVYLGATYRLNGQESPAIGGFIRGPFISCPDADGDGFTACDLDCDDTDPQAYPGNTETCDGIDNDCDGETDEDLGVINCGRGRCTRTVPACVNGVEQRCTPPGPPSHSRSGTEMCGPAGIGVVPVPGP